MPEWIYRLSMWPLAAVVIGTAIAFSLVCLFVVRSFGSRWHFHEATDFGGIIYNAIGVVYALLLAFVTVAGWQNYNSASDAVSREAHALNNIYHAVDHFPAAARDRIHIAIRQYVESIVTDEWPALSKREQSPVTAQLLREWANQIAAFEPTTQNQQIMLTETVRDLSDYRALQHSRLDAAESNIEPPMWFALFLGSGVVVIFACLFKVPSVRLHVLMMVALSISLGLYFYLLIAYDRAFGGAVGLDPTPFSSLLDYWKAL